MGDEIKTTRSVMGDEIETTRSVLGGLGLGGDDLDGGADELPAATMGVFFADTGVRSCRCRDAISPVLGCDKTSTIWGWGRWWVRRAGASGTISLLILSLSLLFSWDVIHLKVK